MRPSDTFATVNVTDERDVSEFNDEPTSALLQLFESPSWHNAALSHNGSWSENDEFELSVTGSSAETYFAANTTGVYAAAAPVYTLAVTVILGALIALLALVTIAGNLLVVASFATDRKLRSFGNYFILNLAISDLIVGLLACVYAPYLLQGCWRLTRPGCLVFLLLDYVVPLASAWNMALISLDRYWSVTRPIAYRTDLNTRRAVVFMCVPWVAGTMWYGPTVLFWSSLSGKNRELGEDQECLSCQVDFFDHVAYLFVSSVMEFILPFATVATINILIYANIRRRSQSLVGFKDVQGTAKVKNLLSRDKKSARSLAILVVVFLVTWGPYEICSFVNPLCGFSIPSSALDVVFWLLWLNSTINPVLYPFLQQRFRVAFVRVLCRLGGRRVPRPSGARSDGRSEVERTERRVPSSNTPPAADNRATTTFRT